MMLPDFCWIQLIIRTTVQLYPFQTSLHVDVWLRKRIKLNFFHLRLISVSAVTLQQPHAQCFVDIFELEARLLLSKHALFSLACTPSRDFDWWRRLANAHSGVVLLDDIQFSISQSF